MRQITRAFTIVFFCCLSFQSAWAAALLGTGGKAGVYYPVGKAICQMVNHKASKYGFRYEARKSNGSVSNINAVIKGNMDLGFAQSDRLYEALHGDAAWQSSGPQRDLRSICSLYSEAVTLVASSKSHISSLDDLKGKTVNIGNRGCGHYKNAMDVLDAARIKQGDLRIKKAKVTRNMTLMQKGEIDAFFYTVGHPNKMIQQLARQMPLVIIPITGPGIDALVRQHPYYTRIRIPGRLYPGAANASATPSVGVKATIVTSKKITNHVVYSLTKALFENFDELRRCHSALRNLDKRGMLEGLNAPIHDGAMLYYREAGLLR